MKVATLVGTRPELIKLSRVIAQLDSTFEHSLVHTGQNFDPELRDVFYDDLDIRRPDADLECQSYGPMGAIANVLTRFDRWLSENPIDAVLVLGDTNSALGVLAAKRRKVPIFHMEAGNRCFDERVPEEVNRRVIDHVSDINMPYTEHARQNLLREGLRADRVIKTGSPQREVIEHVGSRVTNSVVLERLQLEPGGFLLASFHREENVDESSRLQRLAESLNATSELLGLAVVLSTHPRTRRRLDESGIQLSAAIRELAPLGFVDYLRLQTEAYCTISDSGTITEESAILGVPAVTVRDSHERPEGMEQGTLPMVDVGGGPGLLIHAIGLAVDRHRANPDAEIPPDYRPLDVSWRVANVIESYTNLVNREVWRK